MTSGNATARIAERFCATLKARIAATAVVAAAIATVVAIQIAVQIGVLLATRTPALADDPKAMAAHLSDRSFALLNSLNAQSGGGASNPILGPVAAFAADAQTLSHATGTGDQAGAASAMAALESDQATVDTAVTLHPGSLNAADWSALKHQLEALALQIKPAAGSAVASPAATAPKAAAAASIGAASAAAGAAALAPPETSGPAPTLAAPGAESAADPPKVTINSRIATGDHVRVKGWLEGTNLAAAGIYQGATELEAFKIGRTLGPRRVDFDIGVGNPPADAVIRVYDGAGRSAEAPIVEPPPLASVGAPAAAENTEAGVEVLRGSPSADAPPPPAARGDNTAVIPSYGAVTPSPSKRHMPGGQLGNVQVTIIAVNETSSMPATYQIVGQIAGCGIVRAGIYVDGRLVKTIPIESGADYTSFDQTFAMNGTEATIRIYGAGRQFTESSIDLSGGDNAIASNIAPGTIAMPPMAATAPSGLSVQITGLQPLAANLYAVSGVIYGRVSAAGLYQNGMMIQSFPVHGAGGLLGSLIAGLSQHVSFSARFSPAAGPVTVRAFDSSGAYTEQPVMASGGYGVSPYAGAVNPYSSPYSSPYSAYSAPYRAPGPVSPFYPPVNSTAPGPNPGTSAW